MSAAVGNWLLCVAWFIFLGVAWRCSLHLSFGACGTMFCYFQFHPEKALACYPCTRICFILFTFLYHLLETENRNGWWWAQAKREVDYILYKELKVEKKLLCLIINCMQLQGFYELYLGYSGALLSLLLNVKTLWL